MVQFESKINFWLKIRTKISFKPFHFEFKKIFNTKKKLLVLFFVSLMQNLFQFQKQTNTALRFISKAAVDYGHSLHGRNDWPKYDFYDARQREFRLEMQRSWKNVKNNQKCIKLFLNLIFSSFFDFFLALMICIRIFR